MLYHHYIFGEFKESLQPLSPEDLEEIFLQADRQSARIQDLSIEKIVEILDMLAERWLDPDYHHRKAVLERMPAIVGYSRKMTEAALDALFENMHRKNLMRTLRGQLGKLVFLDRFDYNPAYDGYLKAQPLGVVLHVSPGNVFVGGIDSLLYGFLSKNVNLLKVSGRDPVFPLIVARSLQEIDHSGDLANSFCVLNYPGRDREIEAIMKQNCDGIVVIGGEDAVRSYREDLPLGTRLVEYGPRYSFAIVTASGFQEFDQDEIMQRCARDVVMWDQKACSSPQVIFVEDTVMEKFLESFPRHLEILGREFPQENISFDEKVEILKAREMARMDEADGKAELHYSPRSSRWTVIYEESPDFKTSPTNRVVYVKPFKSWADIMSRMIRIKPYLQSVGLLAATDQFKTFSKALARMGVSRITRVGTMYRGKPGSPHDFDFPLRRLINWVNIEWIESRFDLGDYIAPPQPTLSRWERLDNLVKSARGNSEFYRKHLQNTGPIRDYDDFMRVPFLTKHHIYRNTPPVSKDMLTDELVNAYVFASGGSTGEPKFNFYSFREIDKVSSILADIYQIAGVTRGDTVANLFMAGYLWTSFIVVNDALEKIGCVTLPISGNADLDLILRYMQLFKPNVAVGLPSMIIRLAEEIQRRNLGLTIEKILYGGEHFSPEAVKFLEESVGARIIRSAGYASVDAGPIGYQCEKCTGGVHHLLYDYMFFETIDLETDRSVEIGEVGEIVISNFHRRLMPIIRYRTGDLGRVLPNSCPCLHPTPLFELLGRCDDILRVGAMSIYPTMISEALAKVEGLSTIFQLKAHYEDVKEILTVRVETLETKGDIDKLARLTRATLLDHDPELDLVIREGWLKDVQVEILPPGGIPRNPRTGKIRKVVDERNRS